MTDAFELHSKEICYQPHIGKWNHNCTGRLGSARNGTIKKREQFSMMEEKWLLILILAQIKTLALAHILWRMMTLGWSAPVCQIWATSKPKEGRISAKKINKIIHNWSNLGNVDFNSGPHTVNDGIKVVHFCLQNLGHKQAIGRPHVSHGKNKSKKQNWPKSGPHLF